MGLLSAACKAALKRPASAQKGGTNKKPAGKKTSRDARNDQTDDDQPLVAVASKKEEEEEETKKLTPQQRHCWKKAMLIAPGMPGSVPQTVVAEYEKCKKPSERALLINTFVSKTAEYKTNIQFDEAHLQKFKKVFVDVKSSRKGFGKTWTQLRSELGCGNLTAGEEAIKDGLQRGDIIEKKNLYYMAVHEFEEVHGESHGQRLSGSSAKKQGIEFGNMAKELKVHDWAQFALLNQRQQALPANHDEQVTQPPSEEALAHLNTALEKASHLSKNLRNISQQLSMWAARNPEHGDMIPEQVESAMDKLENLETEHLPALQDMVTRKLFQTSDKQIKTALQKFATPFADLERTLASVQALLRTTKVKKERLVNKGQQKKER